MGDGRNSRNVSHDHGRIGRRFDVNELRIVFDAFLQRFQILRIKVPHFDAEPGQEITGNIFCTGILGLAEQRMVTGAYTHEDGPCHGTHPRRI